MKSIHPKDGQGDVVVSWTGGKDGCLACYKAMQEGRHIAYLLNFRQAERRGSHDVNSRLLHAQAEALGLPLLQRDFLSYEQEFKKLFLDLTRSGADIKGAAFGHIKTHGDLVERICRDLEIELILPLWNRSSEQIITEIIDAGFEVILVSAKADLLGEEWLGRKVDMDFLGDLRSVSCSIDPCGENGEFHTFVTDGPIFQKRLRVLEGRTVIRGGYWLWEISDFESVQKRPFHQVRTRDAQAGPP